jgi:hypothetical protein
MTNISTIHAEANALKLEIARLQAELSTRTAILAGLVGNVSGRHSTDAGSFTVSENNEYSEEVMRANLKPGQVVRCEKRILDKAVVKRLYPDVYAAAKNNKGVKVTL